MAYTLIRGDFILVNPDNSSWRTQPDGDTIRFRPDQPTLVDALTRTGVGPDWKWDHTAINLRFEAIDALELHFSGMSQNMTWAKKARDRMLKLAGFTSWDFPNADSVEIKSTQPASVRGYCLSRSLDPHGRPIAFVYPGNPPGGGNSEELTPERAAQSINGILLVEGFAYPGFYSSLPENIRTKFQELTAAARALGGEKVWDVDTANYAEYHSIANRDELESLAIWPKLFRRLASYFSAGFSDLSQFDAWVRDDTVHRDDSLLFLKTDTHAEKYGNMHDLYQIDGNRLKMTARPETLVIDPDPVSSGGGTSGGGSGTGTITGVVPRPHHVRIIGVLPNAVGGGTEPGERVTIINYGPDPVDLGGWRLQDQAGTIKPLSGTLPPGEALSIANRPEIGLNNSGDSVSLIDDTDAVVDHVSYTQSQAANEGWTITYG